MDWIVRRATSCSWETQLNGSPPSEVDNVRLTDCRSSDLSEGNESRDPGHLAYQEVCTQLAGAFTFRFEELAQSHGGEKHIIEELENIFLSMVRSLLLKHCRCDKRLLSLCRSFFGFVNGCLVMRIKSQHRKNARNNMLGWIETFPDKFTEEGGCLKMQILSLPWDHWEENWKVERRVRRQAMHWTKISNKEGS
ncbi:hypothetical protein PM082_001977 [Marasmius tenuissimus]|nr:hypothetical protein PM082_001977 [Marasmius tenuissimus]